MAQDEEPSVRRGVALNPNAPGDLLRVLARGRDSLVRRGVTLNPNTPEDLLRSLARDEDPPVRRWVAANPRISEGILQDLARDPGQHPTAKAGGLHPPLARAGTIGRLQLYHRWPGTSKQCCAWRSGRRLAQTRKPGKRTATGMDGWKDGYIRNESTFARCGGGPRLPPCTPWPQPCNSGRP